MTKPIPMVCKSCRSPVFKSGTAWFHDVAPRWLATVAREVIKAGGVAEVPLPGGGA